MDAFAPWHIILILIVLVIFVIPVAKILSRVGMSPWLAILAIIPLVNWIFLWVFAFVRWPKDSRPADHFT